MNFSRPGGKFFIWDDAESSAITFSAGLFSPDGSVDGISNGVVTSGGTPVSVVGEGDCATTPGVGSIDVAGGSAMLGSRLSVGIVGSGIGCGVSGSVAMGVSSTESAGESAGEAGGA